MSVSRLVVASFLLVSADLGAQVQPAPATPAQQPAPAVPRVAQSTRASVEALIDRRWLLGRWLATGGVAGPARIAIAYGQPHARGRTVLGTVVPWDSVWRTGANQATQLTAELDITIGNSFIPRGIYTLFTLPTRSGWKLIVSKQNLQWGTEYDPAQDLARIDLRSRTLAEPIESLTFWLIPTAETQGSTTLPRGALKLAWGNVELSTDWRVGR
ncbi:MAG TPA: DUF2911 domain-containing protein [Gemmatimonadaceae bacterium]|nr:DUF2911 domain-containing protein [Gemmatimonadaceae bacterium]